MYLGGQAGQRGYAMAAMLVAIALMAVMMSALLPAWRQQVQREKEAELAFRGEQYARAIYLFTTKNGGQYPPSVDALVQGRYIRKKYKDPMTEDGEFQPIFAGQQQPGPARGGGPGAAPGAGGAGGQRGATFTPPMPTGVGGGLSGAVQGGAGILTVQSKSKEASIRIYNGGAHYNEWRFLYNARGRGRGGPQQAPGMPPGAGRGAPGMPGAPGIGPGGRGMGPGGRGTGPGGRGRGGAGGGLPMPGGRRGGGPG